MVSKFKSILAFGDSHVAGCELTPEEKLFEDYVMGHISIEEAEHRSKQLAFPAIVGQALDIPVYNFAMSGGSNDRSLRLLPQKILEHPDSLILFGWTSPDRTEFYYPEHDIVLGRDQDLFAQVGMQWYDWPLNEITAKYKITSPINNLYVDKFLFSSDNDIKTVNQMFYVEMTCKQLCLDYRHIFIFPELVTGKNKTVFDQINQSKILRCGQTNNLNFGCYINHCEALGHKKLELGHFDRKAHEDFADLILKDLNA